MRSVSPVGRMTNHLQMKILRGDFKMKVGPRYRALPCVDQNQYVLPRTQSVLPKLDSWTDALKISSGSAGSEAALHQAVKLWSVSFLRPVRSVGDAESNPLWLMGMTPQPSHGVLVAHHFFAIHRRQRTTQWYETVWKRIARRTASAVSTRASRKA